MKIDVPRSFLADRRLHAGRRVRQLGVVGTTAAIWLIAAVAALGALDVGNTFFAQRSLQTQADMAATAAAQVADTACTHAKSIAAGNAALNGYDSTATGSTITTTCGRWDATLNPGPTFYTANETPVNAAQVTLMRARPFLFIPLLQPKQLTAMATAKATNVGAFTIGTSLATVDLSSTSAVSPSVLNGLLNGMLGSSLNLSAVSYQGLANARFRIRDLVAAANVGTVDQLLAMNISAAQLASYMLTALSTTTVANASLSTATDALNAVVNANIPGGLNIPLGNSAGTPGLLSIQLANTESALDATISPIDALFVAAEIAQAGKSAINVAGGLNLGVLSANLSVQIIQPPVLAIGEAGQLPSGVWRTQASSAQVRAYLVVTIAALPAIPLISLPSANIQLPISVQVAPGTAWLQSTQCAATPAASNSVIGVQTGIASICIANPPTNTSASAAFSCSNPATLVNVIDSTTKTSIVTVTAAIQVPATVAAANAVTLTFDGVVGNADDYQTTSSNALGGVLSNALSGFGRSLTPASVTVNVFNNPVLTGLLSILGGIVVGAIQPVLSTLLPALDTVLVPVLQLLGAQVGSSTIHDLSLSCGVSQLVY